MRKLIAGLIMVVLMASTSIGATLVFDGAPGATGYIVYYHDGTDQWSKNIGNTTSMDISELGLTPGDYVFCVTAYNTFGESTKSNTAEYTVEGYVPVDNPKPVIINIPGQVTININL